MRILIPYEIDQTLKHLVTKFIHTEFALVGKTRIDGQDIYVEELRVPPQESSSGEVETDKGAFLEELLNADEDPLVWNFCIHSHNTMGAFWSPTDKDKMEQLNKGNTQFMFHMVLSYQNNNFKRLACYTAYLPFRATMDNIPVEILPPIENSELVALETQLTQAKSLVKRIETEINSLSDVLPETAEILEKELEKKNKSHKWTPKDKTGGFYDDKDLFSSFSKAKMPYNLYDRTSRMMRIHNLTIRVVGHVGVCQCESCQELETLSVLQDLDDKFITQKNATKYLRGGHPITCQCNKCAAGRAILSINAIYA